MSADSLIKDRLKTCSIIAAKAVFVLCFLAWSARTAPSIHLLGLTILIVVYAIFSTIGSLHFTVINRAFRRYKLNPTGKLAEMNNKWTGKTLLIFILSLVSGFVFLLNSPKWTFTQWVIVVCAFLFYFLAYLILLCSVFRKQYAVRYDRALAMQASFWIIGILACIAYAFFFSSGTSQSYPTLSETFDCAVRPYSDSPSILFSQLDNLSAFFDSVISFGLSETRGYSVAFEIVFNFTSFAAVVFGVLGLAGFCLLSRDEILDEIRPLRLPYEESQNRKILKRYLLIFFLIAVTLFLVLNCAEKELRQDSEANQETQLQSFINERQQDFVFLFDGSYDQLKKANEIMRAYSSERDMLINELSPALDESISSYYEACQSNVDKYLSWRESPLGFISETLANIGLTEQAKNELQTQLSKDVDSSHVQSQYIELQERLNTLTRRYITEFAEDGGGYSMTYADALESRLTNKELSLWSIFDNPVYALQINEMLGSNLDQDARAEAIRNLIEEARANTLDSIKTEERLML